MSGTQRISDAAANLSWTLLDFGARSGRVRSAHRLLDAAAATTNRVTQQTVLSVMQSYYAALAADADVAAARTNETVSARSLEVARGRRSGGIATLADVLQAETAYDQAVLARVQTEGTARSAHGGLAVVIGSTADQPFTLAEEPVPTNIPTLTARMQDLMAEAMQQRPDLAAARAQSEAAEASVTVARAAGWPTISIAAGRSYIETQGLPLQNYSTVGINVTWPIFTGFQTSYGIRQALAAVQASEANAEQVRLNVSLDVWNGYYALDSANKQLAATAALSKSAAENEEVALGRYESGVGSIVDVLTAQSAAASARHQRVVAELTWRDARAQLALALGHLTATEPLSDPKAFP